MTDWWQVSAEWASAAGSFAAVVAALYIAGRGWRDAAAREMRAQATLVHCYTACGAPLQGAGRRGNDRAVFVVRNDSNQPIYRVEIPGTEIKIPLITADSYTSYAMTPAEAESFGTSPADNRYPAAVEFSDAAGLRWSRDRDGSMQQPTPRGRQEKLWWPPRRPGKT